MVPLASLRGRAVRTAYLSRRSFNLDFGVHVVRDLWRRIIEARIMIEALC